MEKMVETALATGIEGRIVNVSSGIHTWFSGDVLRYLDLVTRKKIEYDATRTYALSKLANVLHTIVLAEKLQVKICRDRSPYKYPINRSNSFLQFIILSYPIRKWVCELRLTVFIPESYELASPAIEMDFSQI